MRQSLATWVACSTLVLFSGCQAPPQNSAQIQDMETRIAALEKKVEELANRPSPPSEPSAQETPTADSTPAEMEQTPAEQTSSGGDALWKTLKYDDLPSPELLKNLVSLGFLPKAGITSQEAFEGELTRGQYIALLVEMNNLLHKGGDEIRLARQGDGQAFEDVPVTHPYYKYIQGMMDAGFVIGFNEKSFQPDKPLTREEMVAIAAKRDYKFDDFNSDYYWRSYASFTDKEEIAPKYRDAIARDNSDSYSSLKEAFGELKLFHPKRNVRAYEAILSVHGVGGHSSYKFDELVRESQGTK